MIEYQDYAARQLRWHEIRWRRKARAGKNSFPPTPFIFARPSVSVLRAKRAIILDFAQRMFELRPKNTARQDFSSFQRLPRGGFAAARLQFERVFWAKTKLPKNLKINRLEPYFVRAKEIF